MASLWEKGGMLIERGGVLCENAECPCDDEEEEETTYVCNPCCATAAEQWTVTLPGGFTNGDDCTACSSLSGASFVLSPDGSCRWQFSDPAYCAACQDDTNFDLLITLSLSSDLSNACVATLELQLIGPDDSACRGDIITWQKVYGAGSDLFCEGDELPWLSSVLDGPACNNYPHSNVTLARG